MQLLEFHLLLKVIEFLDLYGVQCISFFDDNTAKYLKQFDMNDLIKNETDKHCMMFGSEKFTNPDHMLIESAYRNRHPLVEIALRNGADRYDMAALWAAYGGNLQILIKLIELGANNYDHISEEAAFGGHQHIIDHMLNLGVTCYDKIMAWAAYGGCKSIVEQMLDLGTTDRKDAIRQARMKGHQRIIDFLDGY